MTTLTTFLSYLHPTLDALTLPSLPLHIRLRLLAFQPLALLSYSLNHILCHLTPPPSLRPKTTFIPVRDNRTLRALVYTPTTRPATNNDSDQTQQVGSRPRPRQYPVHIDIHSGAFIAGHPEGNARFCRFLAENGFLVVSMSYRFAPRWRFPAQIEDVRDVVGWVVRGGLRHVVGLGVGGGGELDLDLGRVTVGGASAGASLALAGCLIGDGVDDGDGDNGEDRTETEVDRWSGDEWAEIAKKVKGIVTFYAPIDLTIPPTQKPKPADYPTFDPLSFLLPLFDVYAASARDRGYSRSAMLSPCLAGAEQIPGRVLMVVAGVDVCAWEQVEWVGRVNGEVNGKGDGKERQKEKEKVGVMVMDGCWHGWLEFPGIFVDEMIRTKVFRRCVEFLREVGRD